MEWRSFVVWRRSVGSNSQICQFPSLMHLSPHLSNLLCQLSNHLILLRNDRVCYYGLIQTNVFTFPIIFSFPCNRFLPWKKSLGTLDFVKYQCSSSFSTQISSSYLINAKQLKGSYVSYCF